MSKSQREGGAEVGGWLSRGGDMERNFRTLIQMCMVYQDGSY